ncbi:hypothetical protein IID22_04440 [Patescibacteria group bacterium]|nr:hypothetical protein [Patescibacteria group bacterium]
MADIIVNGSMKYEVGIRVSVRNLLIALLAFLFLLFLSIIYDSRFSILAGHCPATDYDCQIVEIQGEIDTLSPAHEYNKQELEDLRAQLKDLEKRISGLSNQLEVVEADILSREEDLAYAEKIFEEKTENHYKFLRLYDPLLPFLSSDDASSAFLEISLRQKAAGEDIKTMEAYTEDLYKLNVDRDNLERNKENLASVRNQVANREQFLEGEVEKTESYLASLTSRQGELLALKAGGFQTSIGDTPPTLEPCSGPPGSSNFCDPGFRPAFAAFSFGAPHRTGMSQYGAYGRSKSGQAAEQILAAYYQGSELNKGYPVPATITVSGYGAIPFEDNYLLGIYEVPESWGDSGGFEALKAQAVAARSYALAVTGGGSGTICPTESCQVYKPQLKSGKWAEAVRATRGWVITRGGTPATTYYASTAGGFTITNWGWNGIKDTSGDWPSAAYEKVSGSPWFYKGWYKKRGGESCGRSHPWLTSRELADVLNAELVIHNKVGGDIGRISPVDTNCWGGNPYSVDELSSIGGYESVNSVSVVYSNDGSTLQVSFGTNKGTITISGTELKKAFNLRAPGYIGLKSSLFNIEKL